MNYDSFDYRQGKIKLSLLDSELMEILMDFGASIDGHGYDGGDYNKAFERLHNLFHLEDEEKKSEELTPPTDKPEEEEV